MSWLLYLLMFIFSCFILAKSSSWAVQSIIRISQFLKLKEFVVSFILMAFASSLPELFVGISSAVHKISELSFGDIIGANVINLTLIIGLTALIGKGISIESHIARKDALYTAFIAILPVITLFDRIISRADAFILILVTLFYFSQVFSQKDVFTRVLKNGFQRRTAEAWKRFFIDLFLFIFSVFLLIASAEGITRSALFFVDFFRVSLVFFGILIVAIGTTLPELMFGLKSVLMGHKEMVLGNVMGSVVVNSSLILALVALIYPIKISNFSPFWGGIIFTFISAIFFYFFAKSHNNISDKEGKYLIIFYFIFVLFELILQLC